MKLKKSVSELKEYLATHDMSEYCNPLFAFTYGPMLAKYPDFAKTLDDLCLEEKTFIPFKYGVYLMRLLENCALSDLSKFLKSMTIDLDTLKSRFESKEGYDLSTWNTMEEGLKQYTLEVIKAVRKCQQSGNESVMSGYAPIVPYGIELKKQGVDMVFTPIFAENLDDYITFESTQTSEQNLNNLYTGWLETSEDAECHHNPKSIMFYWGILCENIRAYIEFAYKLYEIDSVNAAMQCAMNLMGEYPDKVGLLYGAVYLFNLDKSGVQISQAQLSELKHQMTALLQSDKPMTEVQFASVFEALSKWEDGAAKEAMEAWSALSDDTQKAASGILGGTQKIYKFSSEFNLDALLAKLYNMRYIEFTDVANQKLIELLGDRLKNVNYMDDNMIICEVDDDMIMVPYVDIANDYSIRVLTSARDSDEIEESVPIEAFDITDTTVN